MIRTLVVDDHVLFAEALGAMLEREGYEIVDVVTTGRGALDAVERMRPDLVLLDLGLPDVNGVDVAPAILDVSPSTKLLAVSADADAASVREALRAGFHGYITKESSLTDLVRSLDALLGGHTVLPRQGGQRAPAVSSSLQRSMRGAAQLTRREREVLELLAHGVTTKGIARRLHIAPNTVRSHIQGVLNKLQVHSRLEAVALASRLGVTSRSGFAEG